MQNLEQHERRFPTKEAKTRRERGDGQPTPGNRTTDLELQTSANDRLLMRSETDKTRLQNFMAALGQRVRGPGRIYLTGGATAILHGWRPMTIDVDLKPDPEPAGLFEAIAQLKDELDINVELASPDDFIPEIPGWREGSLFIARHGSLDFYHYDPYGQALSKLQRRHDRDLQDVRCMLRDGLIQTGRLRELFEAIEPALIRYPAIDPASFRAAVLQFCESAA